MVFHMSSLGCWISYPWFQLDKDMYLSDIHLILIYTAKEIHKYLNFTEKLNSFEIYLQIYNVLF